MAIKIKKECRESQGHTKNALTRKCLNSNLAPRVEHLGILKISAGLVIRNSQTQKCRAIERAKMDPRPWMKSSPQGASSTSGVIQAPFIFFCELFLKSRKKCLLKLGSPHSWMRLVKTLIQRYQMLLRCISLATNCFYKAKLRCFCSKSDLGGCQLEYILSTSDTVLVRTNHF